MSIHQITLAALICAYIFATIPELHATRVTLTNNSYANVVVAISPRIGKQDKSVIIFQLQKLFNSASYALYNATGNRAAFQDVKVVFPPYWSDSVKQPLNKLAAQELKWDGPYPSFETADIRVDVENAAYGDNPYTQQSRGCGEPGDFIHLTLSFIADQTNLDYNGKLLAVEWVKYRYGVFEEMGRKGDLIYPQMYYDSGGNAKYSICSNADVVWKKRSKSSVEGLDDFCDLKADTTAWANKDVNTSMMSPPVLPVAYTFCNETTHNRDAPNRHNVLCSGQSIMDVILQHSDFTNSSNNPGANNNVLSVNVQEYSTIAKETLEVIFVYDSMPRSYLSTMRPTLAKFIYYDFPNNSYVGIVTTATNSSYGPQLPSTKVSSSNRNDIVSNITDVTSSEYKVGDIPTAVATATNAFTQDQNVFARAIIVFSHFATSQDLLAACQTANTSNSQLHLITYSASAASAFQSISGCPGRLYLIQGLKSNLSDTDFSNCYEHLQQRAMLDNVLMNMPNTILPDAFGRPVVFLQQIAVSDNSLINSTFIIDVTPSSMKTYFYGETCEDKLYGCDPNNLIKFLLNGQGLLSLNSSTKGYFSSFPLNKVGNWSYMVQQWQCPNGRPVPYLVTAAGQPVIDSTTGTSSSNNIEIKAWTVMTTTNGLPLVRVFASVKMETTPIFNAIVKVNVTSSFPNSAVAIITLNDDGSGNPDITAQDGVYSGYFTQFVKSSTSVWYSMVASVTDGDAAAYPITTYPWISGVTNMKTTTISNFRYIVQAGTFSAISGSLDVYPPGTIRDFHVQSVSQQNVTVGWTAPGGDYDYGRAASYLFACVNDKSKFNNVLKLNFILSDSNVPKATPEVAKTVQRASFSGNRDSKLYYCAMQAVDDVNNFGPISNIITYSIVKSQDGLSTGAIAGIVVAVILVVVLLCILLWCFYFCYSKPPKQPMT